jgi:uncharacterized membrane protein
MKPSFISLRLLLGIAALVLSGFALAATYTFTTLDALDASQTTAFGINNAEHIVGTYSTSTVKHGFLFKNGRFTTIDYPIGKPLPNDFFTIAYGVNSHDTIVGTYNVGLGLPFAFLFNGTTYSTIQSSLFLVAEARGINDAGTICGFFSYTNKPGLHSYLLKKGIFTVVDFPGSGSISTKALGINNAEQIVGVYYDTAGKIHGYIYRGSSFTNIERPGATTTIPYGINSAEHIVGSFVAANKTHGFLLANGQFTTIDFPNATFTEALGINSTGHIVGDYRDAAGKTHGFIAVPTRQGNSTQQQSGSNGVLTLPF